MTILVHLVAISSESSEIGTNYCMVIRIPIGLYPGPEIDDLERRRMAILREITV